MTIEHLHCYFIIQWRSSCNIFNNITFLLINLLLRPSCNLLEFPHCYFTIYCIIFNLLFKFYKFLYIIMLLNIASCIITSYFLPYPISVLYMYPVSVIVLHSKMASPPKQCSTQAHPSCCGIKQFSLGALVLVWLQHQSLNLDITC